MFKSNLWTDCKGGILTTELVLVASVVTATLVAGLGTMRSQMTSEFQDLSTTIQRAKISQVAPPFAHNEIETNAPILKGTEIEGAFDVLSQ